MLSTAEAAELVFGTWRESTDIARWLTRHLTGTTPVTDVARGTSAAPGAPSVPKLAMLQRRDVLAGSALQVLMAAVGSFPFPLNATVLIGWARVGGELSVRVAEPVHSVASLPLVPVAIGLALRRGTPSVAASWEPVTQKLSSLFFAAGLVLGIGSSWQQIVSVLGSRILLTAAGYTVLSAVAGGALATW